MPGLPAPSEEEISLYQDIVRKEVEKFHSNHKDFSSAMLTDKELQELAKNYPNGNELLRQLIKRGMIIDLCGKYRSAHMDLLAKVVHARPYINSPPVVLEYDIRLDEEYYPDFGAVRFTSILDDVEKKLRSDGLSDADISLIKKILENVITKGIKGKGFSSYQAYVIKQILDQYNHYIPIVAPTATGKTIIFTLPAIVYVLEAVIRNEEPINVVFIYPRKALAKDQVERLLNLVYEVNQELSKVGKKVTIALEDGDTPYRKDIKSGDEYRGLKCPKCGGKLVYTNAGIKCSSCNRDYSFLLATREDIEDKTPNILVTNLWTFYRRMLNPNRASNFKNIKYIVLDEVHAYDNMLAQHLRYILRLLNLLKTLSNSPPVDKIIFSSATIPNHLEFLSSIVCCRSNHCISNIPTFNEFYSKNNQNKNKKRLILYLFLFPNVRKGIDTVTEYAVEVSLAWLKNKGFKGILFADSVAGTTKLFKYFVNTILGKRQAREIRDHICYTNPNDLCGNNEYYWNYLQCYKYVCGNDDNLEKLAKDLKENIELHNALLPPQRRWEIEERFKSSNSPLLLLFSTSTLELGIDIGDIALVIQHKFPISRESFIQRIGRAGRSEKTFRIATGIVTLQTSPFITLYLYNQDLMNKLISLSKGVPAQYGLISNSNIILQYLFSYLLVERSVSKTKTCVDDGSFRNECEDIAKKLVEELVKRLDDQDFVKKLAEDLCLDPSQISEAKDILKSFHEQAHHNDTDCENLIELLTSNRDNLTENLGKVDMTLNDDQFNELAEKVLDEERLKEFKSDRDYIVEFLDYIDTYSNNIFDELDRGYGYNDTIDRLLNKLEPYTKKIEESINKLTKLKQHIEESLIKLSQNKKTEDWGEEVKAEDTQKFLKKLGNLINDLNEVKENINKLKDRLKRAKNKEGCLLLLLKKNNISEDNSTPDIFNVLNNLFNNNVFMDLLMTTPAPVINLELDTEEGNDEND